MTEKNDKLRTAIETSLGHRMQTPKDFDLLRDHIYSRLRILISPTTLKRVWGYLPNTSEPSLKTLDTLAQFVGYQDYDSFCLHTQDMVSSNPVLSRHINVENDLSQNDTLTLFWQPDRKCAIRYLGRQQFVVTASENTRLQQGDTFLCSLIIEGEPLYLSQLRQGERQPVNYVCGKQDGVRFEIPHNAE